MLSTYSHADAAYTYVGAQALPYPGAFPEDAHGAVLFPVEDAGEHVVHIGARADQEEDDEEEGLEVEEGGLHRGAAGISIGVVDLKGVGVLDIPWLLAVSLAECCDCWFVSSIALSRSDVYWQREV